MKDSFSSGYLRYYERYRHGSVAFVVIKKQGQDRGSSSWGWRSRAATRDERSCGQVLEMCAHVRQQNLALIALWVATYGSGWLLQRLRLVCKLPARQL